VAKEENNNSSGTYSANIETSMSARDHELTLVRAAAKTARTRVNGEAWRWRQQQPAGRKVAATKLAVGNMCRAPKVRGQPCSLLGNLCRKEGVEGQVGDGRCAYGLYL